MCITTRSLANGEEALLNIIATRSGKVDRVCASSLSVEAYAMVGAVACAGWVQQAYLEMASSHFNPEHARLRAGEWSHSTADDPPRLEFCGILAGRSNCEPKLKECLAITDAKSLYDSMLKEAKGKEPRVALAVGEIKQGLAAIGASPRWVPHNTMIVDGFTKELSKSNLQPLIAVMKAGTYKMKGEHDEKVYREQVKASGSAITRLKGMARTAARSTT